MSSQRKVRKDFKPAKEYSVDVSGCTEEEKKEVQQAFFDAGFPWKWGGKEYRLLHAARYTNTTDCGNITTYLMYGDTSDGSNMPPNEFLELVYAPEQLGHVHAELMAQYAEDAKTHAEPWKLWQIKAGSLDWIDCTVSILWDPSCEFRRRPKTHIVNGIEIPDLRFSPKFNESYHCPSPDSPALTSRRMYAPLNASLNAAHEHRIKNGLCYEPTEEGRQAAILHAKAMLATRKGSNHDKQES